MPSTKILLIAAASCFLLAFAVPTVAITVDEAAERDGVGLEPTDAQYATIEDDEITLDLEALNDRAITRADDVFTITVTDDNVERIWIDHDVSGLTFYRGDQPTATISESNPLEPSAGTVASIGVAVDTHVAQSGTETFTVTVKYADDDNSSARSAGGSSGSAPSESPAIERSSVDVSPSTVGAGETVTATATYRNVGETTESVTATLTVDGTAVDRRTITLEPGESRTVTFERTMEWAGTYEVGIDGTGSASVTVEGPPIEVVDATVVDPDISVGESTTIRATVRNPTDERVTRTLEPSVDGIVVDGRAVSVPANGERTVSFERRFDKPGTYDLAVSGVTAGTVSVDRAAFSIRDRELSPATTAALAPPATAGLLFLAIAANRRWALLR
ncbi:CARDB domain-containing protein [Natrinema amylolyticum]|uniref:CARDB domain-containing protein n=1 Tax=Natrinema amylolyticum TaxID=2878679 RepID=UPI001CF9EF8E|nr:CARDB domain-containing protein [Natrinema amylolyticum]